MLKETWFDSFEGSGNEHVIVLGCDHDLSEDESSFGHHEKHIEAYQFLAENLAHK